MNMRRRLPAYQSLQYGSTVFPPFILILANHDHHHLNRMNTVVETTRPLFLASLTGNNNTNEYEVPLILEA